MYTRTHTHTEHRRRKLQEKNRREREREGEVHSAYKIHEIEYLPENESPSIAIERSKGNNDIINMAFSCQIIYETNAKLRKLEL